MARHVRAISSFINATYVSRIAPNHCPRVRAITSIVKGNYPVYTLSVCVSAISRGTAISRIPETDFSDEAWPWYIECRLKLKNFPILAYNEEFYN